MPFMDVEPQEGSGGVSNQILILSNVGLWCLRDRNQYPDEEMYKTRSRKVVSAPVPTGSVGATLPARRCVHQSRNPFSPMCAIDFYGGVIM